MSSFFVVSFTTSPTRIHKCKPMIDSILSQKQKPDLFLLQIPKVFERTKETYILPDFLLNQTDVEIMYTDIDYGPGTKLIPTVHYLQKKGFPLQTRIVYCDDDIQYPSTMLQELKGTNPNIIWASSVFDFKKQWTQYKLASVMTHTQKGHVCEGFGGVCVSLGMFSDDFEPYIKSCLQETILRTSDDVLFSNYFAKKQIPICLYSTFLYNKLSLRVLSYGNEKDALHLGADHTIDYNGKRYTESLRLLETLGIYYFSISRKSGLSMFF